MSNREWMWVWVWVGVFKGKEQSLEYSPRTLKYKQQSLYSIKIINHVLNTTQRSTLYYNSIDETAESTLIWSHIILVVAIDEVSISRTLHYLNIQIRVRLDFEKPRQFIDYDEYNSDS
ncbi:hypothetical protein I4U23_028278 [Adineta vaga]|nr:hypothetical protein I4U23_028278 [Adineta vaga]